MPVLRCLTLNLWGAEPPLEAAHGPDRRGHRDAGARRGRAAGGPRLPRPAQPGRDAGRGPPGCTRSSRRRWPFAAGTRGWRSCRGRPSWPTSRASCRTPPPRSAGSCCRPRSTVGDAPVWVHTTHLNYRLHHGREREDQVMAIDDGGGQRARQRAPDPDGRLQRPARVRRDPLAERPDHARRAAHVCYQDAWARLPPGRAGLDLGVGQPLHRGAGLPAARPPPRLHLRHARAARRARAHPDCRIVFDSPTDGVFASDHYGVLAEMQIAADPGPPRAVA